MFCIKDYILYFVTKTKHKVKQANLWNIVKHLCSKIFQKIITKTAERYVTLWKSLGKSFAGSEPSYNMIYLTWLEQFASIFPGICFYHSFYSMVWNSDQFKGIFQGNTFSSRQLPFIIKQIYLFLNNLNVQSFSICWSRWGNFESDPEICK